MDKYLLKLARQRAKTEGVSDEILLVTTAKYFNSLVNWYCRYGIDRLLKEISKPVYKCSIALWDKIVDIDGGK